MRRSSLPDGDGSSGVTQVVKQAMRRKMSFREMPIPRVLHCWWWGTDLDGSPCELQRKHGFDVFISMQWKQSNQTKI